jgi:thiamine pyrophosphokinase
LDHTLANLNALYTFSNIEVVLMGDGNLVRLLPSGTTTIRPHALEGPSCGLVPLAAPAVASSSGLRWNLDDTQVGGRTRAAEATGQGVDVYMLYALPPGPDTYDTMCVGNDFVA